jgi:hypothetical protein
MGTLHPDETEYEDRDTFWRKLVLPPEERMRFPTSPLAFMPIGRMGPSLRSFAADAHDCFRQPSSYRRARLTDCGRIPFDF